MAKDYEAMRAQAAQLMRSRQKKNSYTQGAKRTYFFGYPDNIVGNTTQAGFSDCSAAVAAAIRAVAGINIGSNTNAQIKNRANGTIVDQTDGYYPNENNLLPGDCLYFKGNSGHALDVGHVEMYIGNGKCAGHGRARLLRQPGQQVAPLLHGHSLDRRRGGQRRGDRRHAGRTTAEARLRRH